MFPWLSRLYAKLLCDGFSPSLIIPWRLFSLRSNGKYNSYAITRGERYQRENEMIFVTRDRYIFKLLIDHKCHLNITLRAVHLVIHHKNLINYTRANWIKTFQEWQIQYSKHSWERLENTARFKWLFKTLNSRRKFVAAYRCLVPNGFVYRTMSLSRDLRNHECHRN